MKLNGMPCIESDDILVFDPGRIYKVYSHTNKTNGKMYVGITKSSLKCRWRNGRGYNGYFGKAISKYGWNNFEHELIASGLTKDEACNFEMLLISKLDLTNEINGYNLHVGGTCGALGVTPSNETREKISKARMGKYKGEDNPAYGLKRPDLTKRNLEGSKKVCQLDKRTSELIMVHDSIRSAARMLGKSKSSISSMCNHEGKYSSAYGYAWIFYEEYSAS